MASNVDLNINNYGYAELLALFKLPNDYDAKDLKEAKKIVLKMHPDKSSLPSEYFLFFSKAFKSIVQIYEFKNNASKLNDPYAPKEYKELIKIVPKKGDENSRALGKFIESNDMSDPLKFNAWFNSQFEKVKGHEEEDGYEEWFKSNVDSINDDSSLNSCKTKEEINREFSKKKAMLKSVVKYEGVQEMYANGLGASSLCGSLEEGGGYNSGLFNALSYQDLKQSQIETVMAVSDSDYDAVPKFKTVDEYQRYRDSDRGKLEPLSEKESNNQLLSNKQRQTEDATKRAFYYAKQAEENNEKNNTFWASLKQLTDF